MNDGVKKVKEYLDAKRKEHEKRAKEAGVLFLHDEFTGNELLENGRIESELLGNMRFETTEDLDFDVMDFFFGERLSMLCDLAAEHAEHVDWGVTYDSFKWIVEDLVGWNSVYVKKDEHPALCSKEAYELVLEHLADACERGEERGRG